MDINWSADSGDGVCIEGGDPKDTNHTPFRTISFRKFSSFKLNKVRNRDPHDFEKLQIKNPQKEILQKHADY